MVEFFGRRIKFETGNKIVKYPDLDIEFKINFSDDDDGNTGTVTLYNLSEKTIGQIKVDNDFKLSAGYKDFNGVILPGIIKRKTTNWEDVNKITTLIVGDNTENWLRSTINKTWKAGKRASEIMPEIAKATGLSIGEIDIQDDVIYEKGITFSTTCRKALQELAKDTNSKLHSSRGKVYIRPSNKPDRKAFLIDKDHGLLNFPEKIESDEEDSPERYSLQILLNYKIQTDSLIDLRSKTVEGNFRVVEGEHVGQGENFSTNVEVERIE
ncbi:MAG: phage protein [archaeon]